jgi:histone-lysine N-methyltransferase SETMAR
LLQQDKARHHASAATSDAIARLGLTVLPHPAYSPDLAPSNFHLFPKLKEDLRGQNFSSDKEVEAAVRQWFWEKEKYFSKNGIQTFLNVGKKVLKLEEIMWKSDYGQL